MIQQKLTISAIPHENMSERTIGYGRLNRDETDISILHSKCLQQFENKILLFLFRVVFVDETVLTVGVFGRHDEPGEDTDNADNGDDLKADHSVRSQKVPCVVSMMLTP